MNETSFQTKNCITVYFDIYGFSELLKEHQENIMKTVLEIWRWVIQKFTANDCLIYLFSDCGFILYIIEDQDKNENMLSRCVQDIENLLDKYLEYNLFLKGSISFGSVSFNQRLFVGQPIVDAHRTEAICPGPFIIFPTKEIIKFCEISVLTGFYNIKIIPSKNSDEDLECLVILPADKGHYLREIENLKNKYVRGGPYKYGKFWNDTLKLLINEEII
jgi:hypothetical protein